MSKKKIIVKAFLTAFCCFFLAALSNAENCSSVDIIQYEPDGDCGTLERKCCTNKQWSDWGGECNSCQCTPGALNEMDCSTYMEQSNYTGHVKMTCNSNCKWSYDVSACKTPAFVKFVFEADIPQWYYWEGTFGCSNWLQYVPIYDEQTGRKVAEFQTDRSYSTDSGATERTAYLTSDVVELESDTDYIIGGGIYDCLSKNGSQIKFRCDELSQYFGAICPGCEGSSASNPLVLDGNTCSAY